MAVWLEAAERQCERCGTENYPRVGLRRSKTAVLVLCFMCLADAMHLATGWKLRGQFLQWWAISPLNPDSVLREREKEG